MRKIIKCLIKDIFKHKGDIGIHMDYICKKEIFAQKRVTYAHKQMKSANHNVNTCTVWFKCSWKYGPSVMIIMLQLH